MRMYGKRFIRNDRIRVIESHRETRDGIIWAIDTTTRTVNIRIQGINKDIKAYFPENWHEPPPWCKLGNAVKIMHTGGSRGRIEIFGNGLIVPYPQTGALWPSDPIQENSVLTGLRVSAMPNRDVERVYVTPGTAMIEGTLVTVSEITMDDGDDFKMGDGGIIGNVAAVLNCFPDVDTYIGAYPDWNYRIHSVQLDMSGNITISYGPLFFAFNDGTVYKRVGGGTYSLDNLPRPEVPWGSIELATVLRYEGQSVIHDYDIDFQWRNTSPWSRYSRSPARIDAVFASVVMQWTDSTVNITITCYDNLNQLMYFEEQRMEISIIQGNGELKDLVYDEGYDTTITAHQYRDIVTGVWHPIWYIQYKRGQLVTDVSPTIQFKLLINKEIISYGAIELLDAGGNPMF